MVLDTSDEEEAADVFDFSLADLACFDDAMSCLLDEACAAYHVALREASTPTQRAEEDANAVPCLVDPVCSAKYLKLAMRMRTHPCDSNSACPGGRCNLRTPKLSPAGCSSLVLGRVIRSGLLSSSRHGALYVGEVRDGKLSGWGSLRNRDGTQFAGALAAGVPEGVGRYRFTDGSIFTGGFAKGLPNGTSGTFSVARGEGWYRGGVLNGKAHGEGTVATPDGIELDAHFRNGRPLRGSSRGGAVDVVRQAGGAEALGAAEARAAYAVHLPEWQLVLDRLAGREAGRSAEERKITELSSEYFTAATAVALLLPAALSLLACFAPAPRPRGAVHKKKAT